MEATRKVFVIMPFAPELHDLYLYGVKAPCERVRTPDSPEGRRANLYCMASLIGFISKLTLLIL